MKNPDAIINVSPHYTDQHYREPRTIYGCSEKGLSYAYLDCLWRRNYAKARGAKEAATASNATPKTAKWYEAFMSSYLDKPVEVRHILSGWNWSAGYPYVIIGYLEDAKHASPSDKSVSAKSSWETQGC